MNIIERPLRAGNQFNKPKMLVIHSMGEYINDPDPIFAPDFLEKYGLSAHALIVPNGDVMICREDQSGAYHAKGFNTNSIGVEFLVEGEHDYTSFLEKIKTGYVTPEQWKAGIEFCRSKIQKFSLQNIQRHSDLSPGRKVDPGEGFNWDLFKQEVFS